MSRSCITKLSFSLYSQAPRFIQFLPCIWFRSITQYPITIYLRILRLHPIHNETKKNETIPRFLKVKVKNKTSHPVSSFDKTEKRIKYFNGVQIFEAQYSVVIISKSLFVYFTCWNRSLVAFVEISRFRFRPDRRKLVSLIQVCRFYCSTKMQADQQTWKIEWENLMYLNFVCISISSIVRRQWLVKAAACCNSDGKNVQTTEYAIPIILWWAKWQKNHAQVEMHEQRERREVEKKSGQQNLAFNTNP